ncbi:MAG TPA: hypothetical protein VD978_26640 [Azospirillum sp.]|nr:hypothetical protein [Azospirillum sp.]
MQEYKKSIINAMISVLVGAFLAWVGQQWFANDLEYRQISRDTYLAAPLGQQGLSMYHKGIQLKNISVVEFGIFNRTSKQFNDVEIAFSIDDNKYVDALVSAGIMTPNGLSSSEIAYEVPSKDKGTKKFFIKAVPKNMDSKYFHAAFVFDGDKAPPMSIISLSKDVAVGEYAEWKDAIKYIALLLIVVFVFVLSGFLIGDFADYMIQPRRNRKMVDKYRQFAEDLADSEQGTLNKDAVANAVFVYTSFIKQKKSVFWGKIFGERELPD